ncbi:hypothetical protein MKX03_037839, partial [Papaver bracteatum]
MKFPWSCILVCTVYTIFIQGSSSSSSLASSPLIEAYPSSYGDECDIVLPPPPKREVYGKNGRIIDITHEMRSDLPIFGSPEGVGHLVRLAVSMKNGSLYNISELKLITHTGTHVDAPGHFYDHYFDAGFDVNSLDLDLLNGPVLLVDVPRNMNITGKLLMYKNQFDTSFVGFTQ